MDQNRRARKQRDKVLRQMSDANILLMNIVEDVERLEKEVRHLSACKRTIQKQRDEFNKLRNKIDLENEFRDWESSR